MCNISAGRCG
ncbi:hypothetical protein CV198_22865 [Salmonella enterica]|nr:hypothetical protein [Salmonella enterica]EBD4898038.1 hypothetical protein [Salmonella enterica]ECW1489582.1 hypothetical protein [Salmonella enterica]